MAVEWRRANLDAIGADWRSGEGEARELSIAGVRPPNTERTDMLKRMAIISCMRRSVGPEIALLSAASAQGGVWYY
jgi:hypothetical protein